LARLELIGVQKTYPGGVAAIQGVDLAVEHGELFAIVGPSGSGKTTLLRLVAGLESPDAGKLLLDGRPIGGLAPRDRDVAMVFQDQVLYPHLDTFENMAFGLRARRVDRAEVESRVGATAAVLGLTDCLRRRPATLSGGQRRRVALGRALVLRPRLFLLDEPFSGLDAPLRASTRAELVDLHRKLGATMILVTHDQAEALAIGDRVAVLDRGRVAQVGRPMDLYDRPASRTVAQFVGQPTINLLPCLVARQGEDLLVRLLDFDGLGPWSIPGATCWASELLDHGSPRVDLGLRPEQVAVLPAGAHSPEWLPPIGLATVRRLEPMGHETLAALALGPFELIARLPPRSPCRVGDHVRVGLDFDRASWFDSSTGDRLA